MLAQVPPAPRVIHRLLQPSYIDGGSGAGRTAGEIEDGLLETHGRKRIDVYVPAELVDIFPARRLRYFRSAASDQEVTQPVLGYAERCSVQSPYPRPETEALETLRGCAQV